MMMMTMHKVMYFYILIVTSEGSADLVGVTADINIIDGGGGVEVRDDDSAKRLPPSLVMIGISIRDWLE